MNKPAAIANMAWVSWGYRHQVSLGKFSNATEMLFEQLESLLIVETSWYDHRLCSAPWLFKKKKKNSTPNLQHTTTVTSFSSKMSFNFPFACRQRGGLCLASPFSIHSSSHSITNSCRGAVSVPLLRGSTPCGKWCTCVEECVTPLTPLLPVMEVSLSSFHFLPVSYARWLPLEHESTLSSFSVATEKTLIPKKWNTQKHLPLHLWCAHLSCERNTQPSLNTM